MDALLRLKNLCKRKVLWCGFEGQLNGTKKAFTEKRGVGYNLYVGPIMACFGGQFTRHEKKSKEKNQS